MGGVRVQTFWLEPTDEEAIGLRRFTYGKDGHDCAHGHHSALVYTGQAPLYLDADGEHVPRPMLDHDDEQWPRECEGCGYEFTEADEWQMWQQRIYRRTDNGELRVLHPSAGAPFAPSVEPGACWDAHWRPEKGPDGISLIVVCPGGQAWCVDSRATNCGSPKDKVHHCWVRHGDPRECKVTVDKNGVTCQAGAGSIQTSNWHGFLRNGQLVE